ncbi:MAG: type II secretion system inner membrane protein GspF [Legionellaceae bacterium]|nr:type II secretion system inner membrane protein GspF [Legionellaceae bacterium]
MGAYQYSALKHSGNTSKGVIEADSPSHARQLLRQQGLIPTHVHASARKSNARGKAQFKAKDLTLFTRQLATLLSAAIPLDEALRGVSDQSQKAHVQQLVIGVRAKVLEGYGLAQALGEYPHAFPELYRATVAAGEQTGSLDDVLNKLADYTEHQQETQQKIQQALIYPTLMLVVSITIIGFLLAFVVPKIIAVFAGSGQELPTATRILITFSEGIQSWGLYGILGMIICIVIFKKALNNTQIKLRWHQFLLQIPGVKHLIITTNVARYSHTFSILFAAGVSVLEAMRVGTSLITNLIMRENFALATTHVKEGMPISQALEKTTFFTPMATHLMASGEKSGKIAELMERTAVYLDREIRRLIDTALTLLEPLVILFMGAIIMFIVLATLLPIFSMEQLVS